LINTLYKFATSAEIVARYLSLVPEETPTTTGTAKRSHLNSTGDGWWHRAAQMYAEAPKDLLLGLLIISLTSIMGVVRLVVWQVERRQPDATIDNDDKDKDEDEDEDAGDDDPDDVDDDNDDKKDN
jgi:hypothetical protein